MNEPSSPQDQLMRLILSKWVTKPIYVAAELGIADLLASGPMSIEELSRATATRPDGLYRLLRALASVGIFAEVEDSLFGLTPMAALLRSGAFRATACSFNAEWNDRAWMHLLKGLRRGTTPFEEAFGERFSQWLEKRPREARLLGEANAARAGAYSRALCEGYDFSGVASLVDVGGGQGGLLREILLAYPHLSATLADKPSVLAEARSALKAAGVGERVTLTACDFFLGVPSGGDLYLLANVLHDWPDEEACRILGNCREAMDRSGILLIVEMLVEPGNEPSPVKLLDLEMLVVTGGRERTRGEFEGLLQTSGFSLKRVLPIGQGVFALVAVPGSSPAAGQAP
jgi:hypothetical protein